MVDKIQMKICFRQCVVVVVHLDLDQYSEISPRLSIFFSVIHLELFFTIVLLLMINWFLFAIEFKRKKMIRFDWNKSKCFVFLIVCKVCVWVFVDISDQYLMKLEKIIAFMINKQKNRKFSFFLLDLNY